MGHGRLYAVQVLDIAVFIHRNLQAADNILIFLLEHGGIFAIHRLACCIIFPVIRNLVNKKQAQHFNAFAEQLAFPLDMGKDRFADLDAAQLAFVHFSNHVAGINLNTVQEPYRAVAAINGFHYKPISVFLQAIGIIIKVIADFNHTAFLLDTGCLLHVELQCGRRVPL